MNNVPLDEIRKALEQVTPGEWEWRKKKWEKGDGEYQDGEFCIGELRQKADPGKSYNSILDIQKNKHGQPEIYAWVESDAHLIANAPTWLRSLLEENERLTKERDMWKQATDEYQTIIRKDEIDLQQLREELEQERYNHELTKEELFYEKRATAEVHESLTLRDSAPESTASPSVVEAE